MNRIAMYGVARARIGKFTLVEMLVVIAIIAILAALLMPSLRNAISMAHKAACLNNLRQTGVGIATYADNYNGWGLGANRGDLVLLHYGSTTGPVFLGTLISSGSISMPPDVFYCPSSSFAPSWRRPSWSKTGTQESCWNNNQATQTSYVTSPNLCAYTLAGVDSWVNTRKKLYRFPSGLAIVSDWHGVRTSHSTYGNCPRNHGDDYFNYLRVDGSSRGVTTPDIVLHVENTGATHGSLAGLALLKD